MGVGRLADLVIVGVPKAGTGSLFAYLAQHPDICASDEKETGYCNHYNPRRDAGPPPPLETYAQHFAHGSGERYAMEATPTYSYGGRPVVDALRAVLGSPKIVMILRDPVDRLWSAYTFQRSLGTLAGIGSFEQYLDVLQERRRDADALVPRDGLSGLYIGFYADYLGDWFEEFGADLRVVFTEDLRRDPRSVVTGLCEWLGIDTGIVGGFAVDARNVTRHPRSTRLAQAANVVRRSGHRLDFPPKALRRRLRQAYLRVNSGGELAERFEPELRRRVQEIYRDSNERTASLLAEHGYTDLPGWLRVGTAA